MPRTYIQPKAALKRMTERNIERFEVSVVGKTKENRRGKPPNVWSNEERKCWATITADINLWKGTDFEGRKEPAGPSALNTKFVQCKSRGKKLARPPWQVFVIIKNCRICLSWKVFRKEVYKERSWKSEEESKQVCQKMKKTHGKYKHTHTHIDGRSLSDAWQRISLRKAKTPSQGKEPRKKERKEPQQDLPDAKKWRFLLNCIRFYTYEQRAHSRQTHTPYCYILYYAKSKLTWLQEQNTETLQLCRWEIFCIYIVCRSLIVLHYIITTTTSLHTHHHKLACLAIKVVDTNEKKESLIKTRL